MGDMGTIIGDLGNMGTIIGDMGDEGTIIGDMADEGTIIGEIRTILSDTSEIDSINEAVNSRDNYRNDAVDSCDNRRSDASDIRNDAVDFANDERETDSLNDGTVTHTDAAIARTDEIEQADVDDELPADAPRGTFYRGMKKYQYNWYPLGVESDDTYGDQNELVYV